MTLRLCIELATVIMFTAVVKDKSTLGEFRVCKTLSAIILLPRTPFPNYYRLDARLTHYWAAWRTMFKKSMMSWRFTKWILYYALSQKTDKFNTKLELNQPNQILATTGCLKAKCSSWWLRLVLSTPISVRFGIKWISLLYES